MAGKPPNLIAIDHDDYHAKYVGRLSDGRQFFLTTPFEPAIDGPGREFLAVFLFDAKGAFLEARIDDFGTRASLDETRANALLEQRLRELGEVTYGRIRVAPFSVERFSSTFGLIARPPEEEGDEWAVELQPGNYMAFFAPWNSGTYDT
ncbi:hypothetical protein PHYC_02096 [Phycisphaerales bacterium]|nr:hypothetical protein PHYC_02096 [Phycisphaerales bacterium]